MRHLVDHGLRTQFTASTAEANIMYFVFGNTRSDFYHWILFFADSQARRMHSGGARRVAVSDAFGL
jgi:hypothetical protein